MIQKPKNSKSSKMRLLLAFGLCVALFAATTPSDDSCAEYEHKGSVRVTNNKNYYIEVYIGDNGPYTCGNNQSHVIMYVKPGNHTYV